jgi:Mycothiol maleylpyruvate isomerase N-terminal domain
VTPAVSCFGEAAAAAAGLLARPEVEQHWGEPSVLAHFQVSGLAGHLLRAMTTIETYLGSAPPGEPAISAAEYFVRIASSDIDSPANQAIRARGLEMAAGGPAAVAEAARAAYERLTARLPEENPGRHVQVAGGLVLTLSEYLRTRMVELIVHGDDLAASVGLAFGPLSPDLGGIVIGTLVDVARVRHGDLAVLRALTRRERDQVHALRVF